MPPARRRPKSKPAPKPKTRAKTRARRSGPAWRASMPVLEQRHFDVIGLGLVATAIFFAFVVYLGWDGGQAGDAAVDGLRVLIGAVHYLVPAALMAAGAILVLRPVLPAVRPFKTGAICLFTGLTLALAAGTLGLGPGGTAVTWDAEWVKPRGGMAGEGLYYATSTLLGTLGAHTIALFLLRRRGAPAHGGVDRRRDQGHLRLRQHHHARGPLRGPAPPSRHRGALRARARPAAACERDRAHVPRGRGDAARRARRRRGPRADRRGLAQPRGGDAPAAGGAAARGGPGDRRAGRRAHRAQRGGPDPAGALPRLGHRVARVRVDDPRHRLPQALHGRAEQARHRRPGEGRRPADRGARPLRRRGEGHRHGRGPAHHALRAAPRARASRSPRSPSSRTTSPTRSPPRTSASSRRSRASRRSASRSPTRAGASSTSATCSRTRRRAGRR